jgi:multicomponent Na+:H+ antiporter subunit G
MIYIGWFLIITGLIFVLSGLLGLYRFPDFFTKAHAASVIDSCGLPICFLGLSFLQNSIYSCFKIWFIILLILLLNPVASFALARAASKTKIDQTGRVK